MRITLALSFVLALLVGCNGDKPSKKVIEEAFRQAWSDAHGKKMNWEVLDVVPDKSGKSANVTIMFTGDSGGKVEAAKKDFTFLKVDDKWTLDVEGRRFIAGFAEPVRSRYSTTQQD